MFTNKELGLYLKKIRENLGYSTYDVNKLCDISPSYLSLMENGKRKPSAIILKKLAPIYCTDYLDLYEKAGYIDLIEDAKKEKYQNYKYASYEGYKNDPDLEQEDIEEIERFIEFVKNKRKKK